MRTPVGNARASNRRQCSKGINGYYVRVSDGVVGRGRGRGGVDNVSCRGNSSISNSSISK